MQLTHFGHSCVLVECEVAGGGQARLLFDPGTLSDGLDGLAGLDAVLVTHSHADHLDVDRWAAIVAGSPGCQVVADAASADALAGSGHPAEPTGPGRHTVGGVAVDVVPHAHQTIHPEVPLPPNQGYLVAESLLHPGDAFLVPEHPVDVLLLPVAGPWTKLSETVDYLRAVAPRVAVPIHQAGLAPVHQKLHHDMLARLAPAGTEVRVLEHGVGFTV